MTKDELDNIIRGTILISAAFLLMCAIIMGIIYTVGAMQLNTTASFDDPNITIQDLAFYLVTHDYDAKPMGSYVELKLDNITYKLVPNGNKTGLYDIQENKT